MSTVNQTAPIGAADRAGRAHRARPRDVRHARPRATTSPASSTRRSEAAHPRRRHALARSCTSSTRTRFSTTRTSRRRRSACGSPSATSTRARTSATTARTSPARSSPTTASSPAAGEPGSTRSSSGRPIPSARATSRSPTTSCARRCRSPATSSPTTRRATRRRRSSRRTTRALRELGVRSISTAELFANVSYVALNPGEGFGVLTAIDPTAARPPTIRDVALFTTLPNDLGHVAGVISATPQTPLSHINLKAKQNDTPNAYVRDAPTDPRIAALLGQVVRYEVAPDDFELDGRDARAGRGLAGADPPDAAADAAARPQRDRDPRPRRARPRRRRARRREGRERRRAAQDAARRHGRPTATRSRSRSTTAS